MCPVIHGGDTNESLKALKLSNSIFRTLTKISIVTYTGKKKTPKVFQSKISTMFNSMR